MATPITWQNVNAPSNDAAMRGMESAGQSLTGGLDKFASILANREQVNQGVADRGRQASQEEYLNLVQSYKTPEELQAARMSGVLDQRLASLDPRNQAAVRGAQEARITSLQTQTTAGDTYAKGQKTTADAPMIEQHAQMVASNDTVGAAALRAANPNVNWGNSAQNAWDADRLRSSQGRTDEVAVAAQPGILSRLVQTDALNQIKDPAALAEERARVALQPTVLANAALTAQQEGRVLTDAVQSRALETEVGTMQASFLQDRNEQGKAMGAMATQLGLPVDAAGYPKFNEMGEVARKKFNDFAAANNSPLSDSFMKGDTQAANAFMEKLTLSGKYSPELLAKQRASIFSAFNTNTLRDQTGNDSFNSKLAAAKNDVVNQAKTDKDWYPAGSPAAAAGFEALQKEVVDLIDVTSGIDPEEDVSAVQAFVARMARRGIELDDGTFITPSVQDVRDVIRGAEGGWFKDVTRSKNAENELKKLAKTPEVIKKIQGATVAEQYRQDQQVKALMSSLPPAVTK